MIDLKEMNAISKQGEKYILVVVDVFTRFVFLFALAEKSSLCVARSLLSLFGIIGFPRVLQSDNGKEFSNEILKSVANLGGFDHRFITPYHPQADGLVERFVRTVSESIYKKLSSLGQDISYWSDHLWSTQLSINTKIAAIHNSEPYSLVFARRCLLPSPATGANRVDTGPAQPLSIEGLQTRLDQMTSLVYPVIKEKISQKQIKAIAQFASQKHILKDYFAPGAIVMTKNDARESSDEPRYEGPFKVLRRNKGGSYILLNTDGSEFRRVANQLKLVSQEMELSTESEQVEVNKILDHRSVNGNFEFLVQWKNRPASLNQWVKQTDFAQKAMLDRYWRTVHQPTRKTSKRTRSVSTTSRSRTNRNVSFSTSSSGSTF